MIQVQCKDDGTSSETSTFNGIWILSFLRWAYKVDTYYNQFLHCCVFNAMTIQCLLNEMKQSYYSTFANMSRGN